MSWPALPPHYWADPQSLATQAERGWPPTLPEPAAPDGSRRGRLQTHLASSFRRLPAFPRLCGGERPGGKKGSANDEAGEDGAAIDPQPLPGAPDGLASWLGGAAKPGGRGFREPVRPGAVRLSPWAVARVRLCDRLQPLGARVPPPPPPPRAGLQTAPACLCASYVLLNPGTNGAPPPGRNLPRLPLSWRQSTWCYPPPPPPPPRPCVITGVPEALNTFKNVLKYITKYNIKGQ